MSSQQALIQILNNRAEKNMVYGTEISQLRNILKSEQLENKDYEKKLDNIAKRSCENILRIAVIGEFNAGKSTFINALLRCRLLQEGSLPTTASATYLRCGQNRISVLFNNGHKVNSVKEAKEYLTKRHSIVANDLISVVSALTAKQNIAKTVKKLELSIPKEQGIFIGGGLPSNVELIDTPGFNPGASDVDNHFDVTREVVEEYADMAIILTPAHAAMSATLLSFLENHIKDYLHRCVFVITKIDEQSQADRKKIVTMVERTLLQRFGLKSPQIHTVAARTVLPVKYMPPELEESWREYQQQFCRVESQVWSMLEQSRNISIRASLARFLKSLSGEVYASIEKKKREVQEFERITSGNMLDSVKDVTSKTLNNGCNRLTNDASRYKTNIRDKVKEIRDLTLASCSSIISSGGYLENFKEKEAPQIQQKVATGNNQLVNKTNEYAKELDKQYQRISNDFKVKFKEHYRGLKTLMPEISNYVTNTDVSISFQGHEANRAILQYELSDQEGAAALGAGAVIGQILIPIPVLGAIAGAVAGHIFGRFLKKTLGPPPEKIQAEILKEVKKEVNKVFDSVRDSLLRSIDDEKNAKVNALKKIADIHISKYGHAVEEMRRKTQLLLNNYRNQLQRMSTSLETLNNMEIEFKRTINMQ